METKLEIKSGVDKKATKKIKAGQWYQDVSDFGNDNLYVVSETDNKFALINIKQGSSYVGELSYDIEDIFDGDYNDFVLIGSVKIEICN